MAELDEELDAVSEAKARAAMSDEETPATLGNEFSDMFGEENFDINSIPDREARELSDSEMERIAGMQLDDLLDGTENVSIESLFGNQNSEDDNIEEVTDGEGEISAAQLLGFSGEEAEPVKEDILDEEIPIGDDGNEMSGKKHKKSKKNKKAGKDQPQLEDGLPKKSFGQKVKGLFFEIDDTGSEAVKTEETDDKPHNILPDNEEELDENERLLKSMYGSDIDGEPLDEEEEGAVKLGFFAKIKMLFAKKKAQNAIEEQEEEAAEALEDEERRQKKQEKKEANAAKKEAAKAEKEAKKKQPKPEKPKKEPKPKKVKEPPKPGDILKIKPKTMIALVLFVVGAVILVNLANSTFHYNRAISRAKLFFQNGNYSQAYDELAGLNLEEADYSLYDQICTIMVLEKQSTSYENFTKLKDPVKALDSLIKGVARYQKYAPQAEKLGVSVQFEAAKEKIVKLLLDNYGITYEKACEYVELEKNDFVQYYHTIESYGGK